MGYTTLNLLCAWAVYLPSAKVNKRLLKGLLSGINDVEAAGIESFKTVSRSIENRYLPILNFFNNRSTNASVIHSTLR
jgi:hypothetical protein